MARPRTLTIASFNINGVNARLPNLLAWLDHLKPDVVALQELKCIDADFPHQAIEGLGYGAIWKGERAWNGVALLARGSVPVESRRSLPGDPTDLQSRYIEAAAHGVVIGNLYLPNGNPQPGPKFDYKLKWLARLAKHARSLVDLPHPVALIGDFNVIPTDLDVYDPSAWKKDALIQPEARAGFARILDQGWTDAVSSVFGQEQVFTFWDYFRQHAQRDRGLRIDHLLLNPVLAERLVEVGVDRWVRLEPGASDHAPVWMRVRR
jgi:exodeoxyribonuclease-3